MIKLFFKEELNKIIQKIYVSTDTQSLNKNLKHPEKEILWTNFKYNLKRISTISKEWLKTISHTFNYQCIY